MTNPYYSGPVSDHFDGERFFNIGGEPTDKSLPDLLRWRILGKRAPWPASPEPPVFDDPPARSDRLRVSMIGHASLLIQLDGSNILLDPVWSERAEPLGILDPKRMDPPGIRFMDLPSIDIVLLTHNHYDHFDAPTLRRLHERHRPRFLTPLGNDAILRAIEPDIDVAAGDWGDVFEISPHLRIAFHPAQHWSARSGFDRRRALWSGFVILGRKTIYIAGDTGYGDGAIFRDVAARYGAPHLAILPIGAYEPRWFMRSQHVDPAEAVAILRDCGAHSAVGIHWGTFRLTDEGRHAPALALHEALAAAGIDPARFRALTPGDVWTPPERDEEEPPIV